VSHRKLTTNVTLDPTDDLGAGEISEAANEPAPDLSPDYEAVQAHADAAQYALKKARNATNDGNSALAAVMTDHAVSHLIHAHHALKAAHVMKVGNYLPANKASFECVKALLLAKAAFNSSDLENGRMAIRLASQRLGLVAQSLAKAKLAPELRDVQQSTRLKCVASGASPVCTRAGHW
jgi:hypothetical protein